MTKRRIANFEENLERLIEGGFARLFRGHLQPRDVAVQLIRAIEDNALQATEERESAPTSYAIRLNPADCAVLLEQTPDIQMQLARQVVNYCQEADLFLPGMPDIAILPDDEIAAKKVRIDAHHTQKKQDTTQIMAPIAAAKLAGANPARLILDGQRTIGLNREVFTVGRHPNNDLVLGDLSISRYHCQIRLRQGRYTIYDNQSRSGTFVNGQRIVEHTLRVGDVIRIGPSSLLYMEDRPDRTLTDTQHDLIPPDLSEGQ
jgi:hypothetical protein